MSATPEEMAERAAEAAPRLTEAQRALIAAALGPSVRRAAGAELHLSVERAAQPRRAA